MGDGRALTDPYPPPIDDVPAVVVMRQTVEQVSFGGAPVDAFGYLEEPRHEWRNKFSRIVIPYIPHSDTLEPRAEIHLASIIFDVDEPYMLATANIESDFNCRDRTGDYKGLFQLSDYEFSIFGHGDIWNCRDNAQAFAAMSSLQAQQFKETVGYYPAEAERYIIHQQGAGGEMEHALHPDQPAWRSMCLTDEGSDKGEAWCKRAIWENLLPGWRHIFGTVDKVLSQNFVALWGKRIDGLANYYRRHR